MENNQKEIINIRKNVKHGMRQHRLYKTWLGMIQRCTNQKNPKYNYYGGRGISVHNEWNDVRNFINDMFPIFQEGLSLDRINVNGNYEKSNCRWATKTTQSQNTRLLQSNNKSGYRGVSWHKTNRRWVTTIKVNSKSVHLGSFSNPIDGAKAYDKYIIDNNLEHTRNF